MEAALFGSLGRHYAPFETIGLVSESIVEARHAKRNRSYMKVAHFTNPMEKNKAMLNDLDGQVLV